MHPYMAHRTCRYSTFVPFPYTIFLMCYGLTSYMVFTNSPLNCSSAYFTLGNYTFKYFPGTSKFTTSHCLYESIAIVMNRYSKERFGDEIIFLYFKCILFVLPLAHDLPFTLPSHFNFIKFLASNA